MTALLSYLYGGSLSPALSGAITSLQIVSFLLLGFIFVLLILLFRSVPLLLVAQAECCVGLGAAAALHYVSSSRQDHLSSRYTFFPRVSRPSTYENLSGDDGRAARRPAAVSCPNVSI